MNALENKMLDVLKDLKENNHVIGVKAEFEAEGTRIEEALRLKEVVTKAGLELTIKIGGCEAIKDMYDARAIGVTNLVAPMIESPYALKKYLLSVKNTFPQDERKDISFLINIETVDGYKSFDRMLEIPEISELNGIVLGRVDMTGSLGLKRDDINAEQILGIAKDIFSKAKKRGIKVTCETTPHYFSLTEDALLGYDTNMKMNGRRKRHRWTVPRKMRLLRVKLLLREDSKWPVGAMSLKCSLE